MGDEVCRKPYKVVPQGIAMWYMHRSASMQPALLPKGIKTKTNIIQAKNIPVYFWV